jgi:hypothetical protein
VVEHDNGLASIACEADCCALYVVYGAVGGGAGCGVVAGSLVLVDEVEVSWVVGVIDPNIAKARSATTTMPIT